MAPRTRTSDRSSASERRKSAATSAGPTVIAMANQKGGVAKTTSVASIGAALAEQGRASRMLGARVPAAALADAITRTGPAVVVLWSHTPDTADAGQLASATAARPRPALIAACGPGWEPADLPAGVRTFSGLVQAATEIVSLS